MPNKELTMNNVKFTTQLNKIFNLKESVQPELKSSDLTTIDSFRDCIKSRLNGVHNLPSKDFEENAISSSSDLETMDVLDERENPISVDTIKSQIMNFGPEALGQIITKLNSEMNKVDANGQPTSEYNQFVDTIKQDGLEIILTASAGAGGVKMAPTGGQAKTPAVVPAPGVDKNEPGEELKNL